MKLRKVFITAVFVAWAAGIGVTSAQAAKYTMVISHLAPEDLNNNELHPAMKHFEAILEAATSGEIDVQVFGNGQLGSEVETARQAQAGRLVQASLISSGGGFVAFTNNKRLIRTVADIKGLKIRVEENPAHVATMKALGASATPLPWGEVMTALSTGLADGQFNAPGVTL